MAAPDYLTRVLVEVAQAFAPIGDAVADSEALTHLFLDLGWDLSDDAASALSTALAPLTGPAKKLADDATSGADMNTIIGDIGALATVLVQVVGSAAAALPAPLDNAQFWQGLGDELLQYLVFDHLDRHHPLALGLLGVTGIARLQSVAADATTGRPAYQRRAVTLAPLTAFVASPATALRDTFGWGAVFDHEAAIWTLATLLRGVRAGSELTIADSDLLDTDFDELNPSRGDMTQVVVSAPTLRSGDGTAVAKAALVILPAPPVGDATAAPNGLMLAPTFFGQVADTFTIGSAASLQLSGSVTDTPVRLYLRPSGVSVTVSVADVHVQLGAELDITPPQPITVLGDANASRVELHQAHLKLTADAAAPGLSLAIEAGFDQLRLIVDASKGDGFVAQVLGANPIQVDVAPGLTWSDRIGLRFAGQDGLAVDVPLDASLLGAIHLDQLHVKVHGTDDGPMALDVGVSGSLAVGPFAASVQNVGLTLTARGTDTAQPGNAGIVDLGFGFKPPSGIGLVLDTPAVSGGGFLLIDQAAHQYAGVFELTIVGTVSVKAVAIISTQLPDGKPGFALLVLITADGFTPIPLGMGFTLTGIGGLLALNRTIELDVVRGGLRDGVLDSVLFVRDPVKNASRIISTLDKVFPLAAGRLVIGPLAEITWGTPPLVKIRLALLVEVPQPVRVVLLAQLRLVLPSESAPIVELHVDAVGALDLGRGELALDASIHDSRLLTFALSGDMALRLNWGDAPTFLLSVGGFHPKFPQPAGLRKLERITLALTGSANPRVTFEAYLALTSNTIQMGAKASVYAEDGGFGIDGGGSFDALIQWTPFSLDVSLAAWVRVFGPTGTLLGLQLALEVTGPTPWHITGVASVSVLFFTVHVGVDVSIGTAQARPPVETVDVAAAIWAELGQAASWQASLPADVRPGVTLTPSGSALVAHPLATVTGKQRAAPLDSPIERVGARVPTGGTRTYSAQVYAATGVRVATVTDLFAPAQYANTPDDAKLTGPAFRPMAAGASLAPQQSTAHPTHGVAASSLSLETLDVTSLDTAATAAGSVAHMAVPTTRHIPRPARLLAAQGGVLR
jgi:hypothetical protein